MDLRKATICGDCLAAFRHAKRLRVAGPYVPRTTPSKIIQPLSQRRPHTHESKAGTSRGTAQATNSSSASRNPPTTNLDLPGLHQRVQQLVGSILNHEPSDIPSEQRVLYVMEQLQSVVNSILHEAGTDRPLKHTRRTPSNQETATSALLGSVNARQYSGLVSKAGMLSLLSEKAEKIVRHSHVFISPAVLGAYVDLQATLQQPTSFPDVFDLYARKAVPKLNGSNVEYNYPSPDKINAAIDSKTARTALTAAIQSHNLPLAIDIITTSYATTAYKRAKTLRQASFPISGLALAPVAAYAASGVFSSLQQTMDAGTATGMAFAGIMTYVGAVSMVGYVAVTTANDQMDRVTWASGVPLWERWIREDERAAIDRVAGAWGFRDLDRRGEEEGEEWETLREWIGMRGMILDRVSLMEGME